MSKPILHTTACFRSDGSMYKWTINLALATSYATKKDLEMVGVTQRTGANTRIFFDETDDPVYYDVSDTLGDLRLVIKEAS